jgi:putative membrane protein
MTQLPISNRTAVGSIVGISVLVFLFLLWLLYLKEAPAEAPDSEIDLTFMPAINALLNSGCVVCLVLGLRAILRGEREKHMRFMLSALGLSAVFLVGYLTYHHYHGDTPFEGTGMIRPVYFFILITHIVLSAVMLPMIFTTFYFAATKNFTSHKKLARYTFPVWMYVSVTGVLVYLILYHWPTA